MKFKDKFTDMRPILDEAGDIILGTIDRPCHICKQLTKFVEINYETSFCSEECVEEMDNYVNSFENTGITEDTDLF